MSGRIVGEVLRYAPDDLTETQRWVLLALAESVRDRPAGNRITRTNVAEVAALTRRAPGTVRNALVELTRRALIAPQGKASRGHAQDYRIHPLEAHHRATTARQETAT